MRLGYEAILLKIILFGCHVIDPVLSEKALLGSHENVSILIQKFSGWGADCLSLACLSDTRKDNRILSCHRDPCLY